MKLGLQLGVSRQHNRPMRLGQAWGFVGDSMTVATGYASPAMYNGRGYAAQMRSAMERRIEIVGQADGKPHFAVSGVLATQLAAGGANHATFEAALASSADTLLVHAGANDVASAGYNQADTLAAILSMWDEVIASGKKLVGLPVVPCRSDHPEADYKTRQLALNVLLQAAAQNRRMVYLPGYASVLDDDADGYADSRYLIDTIHRNIEGAAIEGRYLAAMLSPRISLDPVIAIPASGSAKWVSANPYGSGTVGSNQTATGWTVGVAGTGTVAKNIIARTDGVSGNWQELVISGVPEADLRKASPSSYVQCYQRKTGFTGSVGTRYRAAVELVTSDPWFSLMLVLHTSATKGADGNTDGGLNAAWVQAAAMPNPCWLVTPWWTYDTGSEMWAWLYLFGNGTIRIGRFGAFAE